MDGITHILSIINAPWCAWTMLGLLLCAILAEWFQPGVLSQAHTALNVRNDRTYKDAPANFMGQLLISLFRIGTISMALCIAIGAPFWVNFVLTTLIFLVKMLANTIISYTFALSRRFGTPYEHYGNLFTLVAIILYPILLVLLRFDSSVAAQIVLLALVSLAILFWTYRILRTYITTPSAILYLLIYICTLELFPFAGLAYLSAKSISIL